jgi:hypothetical protein
MKERFKVQGIRYMALNHKDWRIIQHLKLIKYLKPCTSLLITPHSAPC